MSFDIALSGIQSINQQLNSTSNNIANASTYGFKSSRANFSAMYAGSRATGTEIGSLTQSMSLNGGVLNTGRALDAAIDGRGYFVVARCAKHHELQPGRHLLGQQRRLPGRLERQAGARLCRRSRAAPPWAPWATC